MGRHEQMARDCWQLIKALGEFEMDADLNAAALNLIEMACDSAAESERMLWHPAPGARRPSITCPACGRVSYHPKDVEYGYCGACHIFREPEKP